MTESRGGLENTGFGGFVKALTRQFAPPECIPLSICFNQPSGWTPTGTVESTDRFFLDTPRPMLNPFPSPLVDIRLAATVNLLPHGFRSLIHQTTLSINTIQLLYRITNASGKQSQTWIHERQDNGPCSSGWQVSRYSDFWECCPSISRVGPDFEKYLCLSLLLYTANEFAPERACHKGMALYGGPRAVLAAEIGMLSRAPLTPAQRHCWIWIWWVVIDSWSEQAKLTETGTLLMSQFWAVFPEVRGWDELRWVLGRFFWGGKFEAAVKVLVETHTPPSSHSPAVVPSVDGIKDS
jgi:hypothetical protein